MLLPKDARLSRKVRSLQSAVCRPGSRRREEEAREKNEARELKKPLGFRVSRAAAELRATASNACLLPIARGVGASAESYEGERPGKEAQARECRSAAVPRALPH